MRPAIGSCQYCQHWTPYQNFGGWGLCVMFGTEDGNRTNGNALAFPVVISPPDDGTPDKAEFVTSEKFGCVQFEGRQYRGGT
jgi:hypothetical protein